MGTERDTVYEGPCRCGDGKFHIKFCNPDHGWPTSTPFWYEFSIECKSCDQVYELQQHENRVVVVEKSEIEKEKKLADESHKRWKLLLGSSEVKKILKNFILFIDSQRSMAAIHRFLAARGLEHSSITTFRKHWRSAQDWVDKHVYYFNLPDIMKLVGNNSNEVLNEVRAIKKLSENSKNLPPSVGKPIYTTNKIA